MKYLVVEKPVLKELTLEVNALIKKGWKPYGGINFKKEAHGNNRGNHYLQAMIKPALSTRLFNLNRKTVTVHRLIKQDIEGKLIFKFLYLCSKILYYVTMLGLLDFINV